MATKTLQIAHRAHVTRTRGPLRGEQAAPARLLKISQVYPALTRLNRRAGARRPLWTPRRQRPGSVSWRNQFPGPSRPFCVLARSAVLPALRGVPFLAQGRPWASARAPLASERGASALAQSRNLLRSAVSTNGFRIPQEDYNKAEGNCPALGRFGQVRAHHLLRAGPAAFRRVRRRLAFSQATGRLHKVEGLSDRGR